MLKLALSFVIGFSFMPAFSQERELDLSDEMSIECKLFGNLEIKNARLQQQFGQFIQHSCENFPSPKAIGEKLKEVLASQNEAELRLFLFPLATRMAFRSTCLRSGFEIGIIGHESKKIVNKRCRKALAAVPGYNEFEANDDLVTYSSGASDLGLERMKNLESNMKTFSGLLPAEFYRRLYSNMESPSFVSRPANMRISTASFFAMLNLAYSGSEISSFKPESLFLVPGQKLMKEFPEIFKY